MLMNVTASLKDGHLVCNAKWMFDKRENVNKADLFKVCFLN